MLAPVRFGWYEKLETIKTLQKRINPHISTVFGWYEKLETIKTSGLSETFWAKYLADTRN